MKFQGDRRTVIDGPFTETKELVAGFWLVALQVQSGGHRVGEALPQATGAESEIEIRQIFDAEDFTNATPEIIAQEEALRKAAASKSHEH